MAKKMGRPREHDRDEIAEKMVIWAKKESSLNLCGFCAEVEIDPCKITQWATDCENFRKAYRHAKALLGERRERRLSEGTLHQKAYGLNAHVYDQFLKDEARDLIKYEADVRKPSEVMDHVVNVVINKIVKGK